MEMMKGIRRGEREVGELRGAVGWSAQPREGVVVRTIYPHRIYAENRELKMADFYGCHSLYLAKTSPEMAEWHGECCTKTLDKYQNDKKKCSS